MNKPLDQMSLHELVVLLGRNQYLSGESRAFPSKLAGDILAEIDERASRAEAEHEELERLREENERLRLLVHMENVPAGMYRCPTCRQLWPIGSAHYCTGNPDYNGKTGIYNWTNRDTE